MSKKTRGRKRTANCRLIQETGPEEWLIGVILILLGIYGILHNSTDTEEWSLSYEGILPYPQPEDVEYSIQVVDNSDNTDVLKTVSFKSRDTYINGFLRFPNSNTEVVGIVLLPEGQV